LIDRGVGADSKSLFSATSIYSAFLFIYISPKVFSSADKEPRSGLNRFFFSISDHGLKLLF